MLPLLREQQGQSQTSTVEERVIGAGLKGLDKLEDGAAVKALLQTFAVTQEDFLHPIAVVELLWRSCCASGSEKQEAKLATRLRVRQRTQLLVDHSLLLGSSSEGVHLHDVVLQYLRKRLSTTQMRAEHKKVNKYMPQIPVITMANSCVGLQVVDGMVAAAAERVKETGRGLFETGTSGE